MLTPLRFPATASNRWPHLEADCWNHEILLAKLYLYGIRGLYEDWFRSYWTNRRQKVEATSPNFTHFFSNWDILKHGVPMGQLKGLFYNIQRVSKRMTRFQIIISNNTKCVTVTIKITNYYVILQVSLTIIINTLCALHLLYGQHQRDSCNSSQTRLRVSSVTDFTAAVILFVSSSKSAGNDGT